jgi:hypothetical protein
MLRLTRKHGNRSGMNKQPARLIRAKAEQFAAWDKAASKAKLTFSEWVRRKLDA